MHSLQPQQNAQLRPRGHDENILEEAYRGRYPRQRLLNFWPESSCGYHAIKRFVCIIQVAHCDFACAAGMARRETSPQTARHRLKTFPRRTIPLTYRTRSGRTLLLNRRMDLGDVASGKFHDGGFPLIGLIWSNEDCHARTFRFCERDLEVCHLISGHFPSIWI